ncbi:MBL fold metallo-hydrolase [Novosphingobium lindaniclasticum]|uniref:Metallo-beta-lactamase domain-containing protein n=1 Tax=Novosphingobium lindaniclasticum LE124 TaxID=1096930 RepID=T0I7F1_9SPHN|nr:MBL fold metallo-hydrolase [Novosphingobium lindaniclasticum]EQB07615.1 hypothetical protein L284_22415 [Novosphingobium lindaniclasticum LE124]
MKFAYLLTALGLLASAPLAAQAPGEAPLKASAPKMHTGQAPGFYRMHVGRFEVTALLDGTHPFQAGRLALNAGPTEVEDKLKARFLASPFEGMINAFLVNTGERLILIDTGAGNLYGPAGGGLTAAIRQAGYDPAEVRDIFITHLHEDHAGGLIYDGAVVFPNAVVHVSKRDADFWLNNANQSQVGDLLRPFFAADQNVVRPYIAAGRFETFDGDAPLLPGLTPIAGPGHTPGHTFYLLQDAGQSMLFWGDTVHIEPVQLPDPNVALLYDWKPKLAVATRKAIFERAAREGWWIAGAHISFPGIGHIRKTSATGFSWVPANYTLNR